MRNRKQKIIVAIKIITASLWAILIAIFVFRNTLLQQAIARVSNKMERDYNSSFSAKTASFVGFSGVSLSDVVLVPNNADTLFSIHKIKTSVNFFRLLIGDIQLGTLEIEKGYVQLVKNKNGRNFEAFLKKDEATTNSNEKRDYAKFAYSIISKVLNLVPTDMKIENLSIRVNDNRNNTTLNFQNLRLVNQQLETSIKVETKTFTQQIRIEGFADPRNKKANIRFFNRDSGSIKMPYLDERYGLKSSFDSIHLSIQNINKSGGELHINGSVSIANLMINHAKIARKDVVIKNARFDFRFLLGSDFVSMDSSSTVQFNKVNSSL